MFRYIKYLILLFMLVFAGCEQWERDAGDIREFFRTPPVEPIISTLHTAQSVGYFSTIAMTDHLGYEVPCDNRFELGGNVIIHQSNKGVYPWEGSGPSYRDIFIIAYGVDDDMVIINIIYVAEDPATEKLFVDQISTIPVLLDEDLIKAVYASNDISIRDEYDMDLNLSPADIEFEIERSEMPVPEETNIAIQQDAWIIEIDQGDSWTDLSDDSYTITGGEQEAAVITDHSGNATRVLQLAMIGIHISNECIVCPTEGFMKRDI